MNEADNAREDSKLEDGSYGVHAQFPQLNADIDNHEMPLRASGGWCAPSEVVYDAGLIGSDLNMNEVLEMITVPREGIRFEMLPLTERQHQEHFANAWLADYSRWLVALHIGSIPMAQHDAIHATVYWARTQPLAWSVHLHKASWSRFVGITVWPEKSGVPTIHEYDLEFEAWGGGTFDADDWCEMFEDL